jgi:hypothetical protein
MTQRPSLWRLGLPSWLIEGGTYDDFTRGQRIEVAVECVAIAPLVAVPEADVSTTYLGEGAEYAIQGTVVHRLGGGALLDCGILERSRASRQPTGSATGQTATTTSWNASSRTFRQR